MYCSCVLLYDCVVVWEVSTCPFPCTLHIWMCGHTRPFAHYGSITLGETGASKQTRIMLEKYVDSVIREKMKLSSP